MVPREMKAKILEGCSVRRLNFTSWTEAPYCVKSLNSEEDCITAEVKSLKQTLNRCSRASTNHCKEVLKMKVGGAKQPCLIWVQRWCQFKLLFLSCVLTDKDRRLKGMTVISNISYATTTKLPSVSLRIVFVGKYDKVTLKHEYSSNDLCTKLLDLI